MNNDELTMDKTIKNKTKKDDITFEDMGLNEALLRGVYKYNFNSPSKIQGTGIPLMLKGRDLIVQSQSGTGKTGTFVISALQLLDCRVNKCQVIILSPTRELALQTNDILNEISQFMNIRTELCVGGTAINESRRNLKKGVHVVIGTPGRVIDMINRNYLITNCIKLIVFDEADELLKGSFIDQMREVIENVPKDAQICLFSATMPEKELEITQHFLRDPLMVLVEKEKLSLKEIRQFYINVEKENFKFGTLCDIYSTISINQAMIYVNTKEKAVDLADDLLKENFTVSVIHSKMPSSERLDVMKKFRNGTTRILVSTDLLARGIDIEQVSIVVNYDLPRNREHYLHRIGRSGRFGRKGVAINLITMRDIGTLRYLEEYYEIEIEPMPQDIKQFL